LNFNSTGGKNLRNVKPEELLSIGESKEFCTFKNLIDLNITAHSIKSDQHYLNKILINSDLKKKRAKLGSFVTEIDHSDLVIRSKLVNVGKTFLKHTIEDAALAKTQMDVKGSTEDEHYNHDTYISKWIRRNFFVNLMAGDRCENVKAKRDCHLNFETLRKRDYLELPDFE
jgi:hypothetical protein